MNKKTAVKNLNQVFEETSTFGGRLADRIAAIGGSWAFILSFLTFLLFWVALNGLVLSRTLRFDPYPYIFLNLVLSMLAALQAPIIMMSQNRQSAKDRLAAEHDFEVNERAEREIYALNEKLDRLQEQHAVEFAALRALLARD